MDNQEPNEQPDDNNTTFDVQNEAQEAIRRFQNEQTPQRADVPTFSDDVTLTFEIEGVVDTLTYQLTGEAVIGRADPMLSEPPEIDLTDFGAYQHGISRRHAVLRLRDGRLELADLGSRNGTYLNGRRLVPHQPMIVASGDSLRMGKIAIRLMVTDAT